MKRRNLLLLLGSAGAGSMTVGTGAFSSVNAEREVVVNVVEDEDAYLGVKQVRTGGVVDEETDLIRLHNLFNSPLGLTATTDDDHVSEFHGEIGVGETEHLKLNCEEPGSFSFTLQLDGNTDSATATKDRSYDVSCVDVEFRGNSGAQIYGTFEDLPVKVEYQDNTTATVKVTAREDDDFAFIPRDTGRQNEGTICNVTVFGQTFASGKCGD